MSDGDLDLAPGTFLAHDQAPPLQGEWTNLVTEFAFRVRRARSGPCWPSERHVLRQQFHSHAQMPWYTDAEWEDVLQMEADLRSADPAEIASATTEDS